MTRKSYKCEQSNNWLIVHIIFQTGQSSTSKAWLILLSAATTADAAKRVQWRATAQHNGGGSVTAQGPYAADVTRTLL